jgi:probable HAF family extracellular repeat protein
MRVLTTVLCFVFVLSVVAQDACAEVRYTFHDLGTGGRTNILVWGMNNSGQVIVTSFNDPSGTAVRYSYRTGPNQAITTSTDNLGTFGGSTLAYGINDSGQVVGYSKDSSGVNHAFRTAPNQPINPATDDLGTLGGSYSEAFGINNLGQVVGYAPVPGSNNHGFVTGPNQPIDPVTDVVGTFGGTSSEVYAINNAGQIVGRASDGTGYRAFLTNGPGPLGPANDLGFLGAFNSATAYDINDSGQVVGASNSIAFLYEGSGPIVDLNTLIAPVAGLTLTTAKAINELGQIAGSCTINGQQHAYRLDPIAVPEPSTPALLGIAAFALLAYGWRQWRPAS